jgi:glycosyltransferase involved in cell wall biosynthesis
MPHRPRFAQATSFEKLPKADAQTPADITVVIPSYNHEAFITEALQSVLAQTYGAFGIIVVDDASTDATAQRALSVQDPRVTVKVNPHNVGLGNSIISVLGDIDTPFTAFLNSDDLFHPVRLARCREIFLNSSETQLVATDLSLIDADGGCLTPDNVSLSHDGRKIYWWVQWFHGKQSTDDSQIPLFVHLLKHNFLVTSSNIICRTEYLRHHAEALKDLKYCLDWQLFLDASLDGQLAYVRERLLAYRLHSENTIWLVDGGRSAYYLETNRVIARALKRFLSSVADSEMEGPEMERVLNGALSHLAANGDVDGLSLCLNVLFQSDEFQEASRPVQRKYELMKMLYAIAQQTPFKRRRVNDSWIRQQARTIKMLWQQRFHRVSV